MNIRRHLDRREYLKVDALAVEAGIVAKLEEGEGQCRDIPTRSAFDGSEVTFAEFARQYLKLQDATRPDFRNKSRDLDRHLVPFFDSTDLKAIKRFHVDRLKAHLRQKRSGRWKRGDPLSPKTINNILGTLKAMLNVALEYELLDRVPVIRKEKVAKRDPEFLTEVQVTDLLASTPKQWIPLVATAVLAGLRRGELLELRWGDIHFDDPRGAYIRVGRSVAIENGTYRIKETKGNSCRSVPLSQTLGEILIQARPTGWREEDLLFAEPQPLTNLGHLRERVLWETVDAAARSAGCRKHIHPHMLRHTFASLSLQRGVPLAVVQQWLGHANISTTERYAHLSVRTGNQFVRSLDFFKKSEIQPPNEPKNRPPEGS